MSQPMHKPEVMHLGICPGECRKRRICVLLPERKGSATRRYYVRKHGCGRRLVPVAGSLAPLGVQPRIKLPVS